MEGIIANAPLSALVASLIGIGFAALTARSILAKEAGSERVQKIGLAIQRGARAFLGREYRFVALFVTVVAVLLLLLSAIPGSGMSPWTAAAYVAGALASALAGYIGMMVATRANTRTTHAATQSLNSGLRVAFASARHSRA